MSKNISGKRLQKMFVKDIKIFQKKKKKKSDNIVLNVTKISQKMKRMYWLSIEKNIIKSEKNSLS